jgi:hypothetical protein
VSVGISGEGGCRRYEVCKMLEVEERVEMRPCFTVDVTQTDRGSFIC